MTPDSRSIVLQVGAVSWCESVVFTFFQGEGASQSQPHISLHTESTSATSLPCKLGVDKRNRHVNTRQKQGQQHPHHWNVYWHLHPISTTSSSTKTSCSTSSTSRRNIKALWDSVVHQAWTSSCTSSCATRCGSNRTNSTTSSTTGMSKPSASRSTEAAKTTTSSAEKSVATDRTTTDNITATTTDDINRQQFRHHVHQDDWWNTPHKINNSNSGCNSNGNNPQHTAAKSETTNVRTASPGRRNEEGTRKRGEHHGSTATVAIQHHATHHGRAITAVTSLAPACFLL